MTARDAVLIAGGPPKMRKKGAPVKPRPGRHVPDGRREATMIVKERYKYEQSCRLWGLGPRNLGPAPANEQCPRGSD